MIGNHQDKYKYKYKHKDKYNLYEQDNAEYDVLFDDPIMAMKKYLHAGGTMNNFCPTPPSAWCLEEEDLGPFASLRHCRCFDDDDDWDYFQDEIMTDEKR